MHILGGDPDDFPPVHCAEAEPDGLLAIGGDLTPPRLLAAYRRGIFPWFSDDRLPMWWSPDPRMVLRPGEVRVSRSLRKRLRRNDFEVTTDQAFDAVLLGCAAPREEGPGTWITSGMHDAYLRMHRLGYGHSVESWQNGELMGGLYGLAIGRVFFGESMFSRVSDASKVAFVRLCEALQTWGFELIDCQVYTEHLESLGAYLVPREEFVTRLRKLSGPDVPDAWPRSTSQQFPQLRTRGSP